MSEPATAAQRRPCRMAYCPNDVSAPDDLCLDHRQPATAATESSYEPLACGCEYVSKYCDEHHWQINAQARQERHQRAERIRIAARLREQPWANALPIADAIEKDEWDV